MGTRAAWTPQRRARQAEVIRSTQPWLHSTGPRSAAGKAISSRNATRFRDDEHSRRIFLALDRLIKHPASVESACLWAMIEASAEAFNWEQIDAIDAAVWSDDDDIDL